MEKERPRRVINCVVLSCLTRPGVIWRFFRRYYFYRLEKQIEHLPAVVRKLGKEYDSSGFFIL